MIPEIERLRDAIQDVQFFRHRELRDAIAECNQALFAASKSHPAIVTTSKVHETSRHLIAIEKADSRGERAEGSLAAVKDFEVWLNIEQELCGQSSPDDHKTARAPGGIAGDDLREVVLAAIVQHHDYESGSISNC